MAAQDGLLRVSKRTRRPNLRYVNEDDDDENVEKKIKKSDKNERAGKAKLEATGQLSKSQSKDLVSTKNGLNQAKKITEPTSSEAVDKVMTPKTTNKLKKHEVTQAISLAQEPKRLVESRICKRQELRPKLMKNKVTIDCSEMAKESLDFKNFDIVDYNNYLVGKIKVGEPQENVKIAHQEFKLVISSKTKIDKSYLKYLTKKYLNKTRLKDWIHVGGKKKNILKLSYFRMAC